MPGAHSSCGGISSGLCKGGGTSQSTRKGEVQVGGEADRFASCVRNERKLLFASISPVTK